MRGQEFAGIQIRESAVPFLLDSSDMGCSPSGNFLIDYHPEMDGLFLATGGSGHGFKFFPVMGDRIVDAIERRLEPALKELWAWPKTPMEDFVACEDGSRAGRKGMILEEELRSAA